MANGWHCQRPAYPDARTCFAQEYVSFTRLQAYAACPRRFRIIYLDGEEEIEPPWLDIYSRGQEFHKVAESYLRRHVGGRVENLSVASFWGGLWPNSVRADLVEPATFFCQIFPRDATVHAVESDLYFFLNGVRFRGIIDAILRYPDGIIELIDFKTGKTPRLIREQLEIYGLACTVHFPMTPVRNRFLCVDRRYDYRWLFGPLHAQQAAERLSLMVEKILADSSFDPVVSSYCNRCSVGHCCLHGRSFGRGLRKKQTARRGTRRPRILDLTPIRFKRPKDGGFIYIEHEAETDARGHKPEATPSARRLHRSSFAGLYERHQSTDSVAAVNPHADAGLAAEQPARDTQGFFLAPAEIGCICGSCAGWIGLGEAHYVRQMNERFHPVCFSNYCRS